MTSVIMHLEAHSQRIVWAVCFSDSPSGCCAENTLSWSTTKAELGGLAATPPRNCQTRIILFLDVATTVAKNIYKAKTKRKFGK